MATCACDVVVVDGQSARVKKAATRIWQEEVVRPAVEKQKRIYGTALAKQSLGRQKRGGPQYTAARTTAMSVRYS